MTTSIYHYGEKALSSFYSWVYQDNDAPLVATQENLRTAIQELGEAALKCTFKDTRTFPQTYSPLEFAVNCGDVDSARSLIGLGANVKYSNQTFGSMAHYYIDCLSENTPPNLEMLHLLLDHMADINDENGGPFHTVLEHTLLHMSHYKQMHLDVIDALLKKGVRITDVNGFTPFTILRDSQDHRISYGAMIRTSEEESLFLNNLGEYLQLEKKYHPKSTSGLNVKEFKFHSTSLHAEISRAAMFLSSSEFIFKSVQSLVKDLDAPLAMEELDDDSEIGEFEEFKARVKSTKNEMAWGQTIDVMRIVSKIIEYHQLFKKVVTEGSFRDCFETWELYSLLPAIAKSHHGDVTIGMLERWGLKIKQKKDDFA